MSVKTILILFCISDLYSWGLNNFLFIDTVWDTCLLACRNSITYLSYYLLTYSTVQSLSWEANWFAASQETPHISRNPKVHYHTHKRSQSLSILGQPNPVHILTSHLLEIHPNIIHPSTPGSPQWSPSLRFPQQDPIHPLLINAVN